jgi:hypothetical protein
MRVRWILVGRDVESADVYKFYKFQIFGSDNIFSKANSINMRAAFKNFDGVLKNTYSTGS